MIEECRSVRPMMAANLQSSKEVSYYYSIAESCLSIALLLAESLSIGLHPKLGDFTSQYSPANPQIYEAGPTIMIESCLATSTTRPMFLEVSAMPGLNMNDIMQCRYEGQ